MHKNYIILAHRNPKQLAELICQLNGINCTFFVHIDSKFAIEPFLEVLPKIKNVKIVKNRFNVVWCDFSTVEATLSILKKIIIDSPLGHTILLSGQDFPIKSNAHINSFLEKNQDTNFIETFPLPTTNWSKKGIDRLEYYKINLSDKKGDYLVIPTIYHKGFYSLPNIKSMIKLSLKLKFNFIPKIFIKRKHPEYINPYGGSQWWSLANTTVKKIINFCDNHPDFLEYHKDTMVPDEIFFQSIIMHLKDIENIKVMDSTTFVDWEREVPVSPPTFSIADKELLLNQPENKLFARKFDSDYDQKIIDELSKHLNL